MKIPTGFWLQLSSTHRDELLALRNEWSNSDQGAPGVVLAPVTTAPKARRDSARVRGQPCVSGPVRAICLIAGQPNDRGTTSRGLWGQADDNGGDETGPFPTTEDCG